MRCEELHSSPWGFRYTCSGGERPARSGNLDGGFVVIEVLRPVHPDELEEVGDRQGPDDQPQQTEVLDSGKGADDGDERVDPGPAPEYHGPYDIVDIPHHQNAPKRKGNSPAVASFQCQRQNARAPHQSAPNHRENREHHRDHRPEQGIGNAGGPEGQSHQSTLYRTYHTGPDQRRYGYVAKAVPQDLGVLPRERDERLDLLPGGVGFQQEIVQAEKGDGQLDP